MTLPSVFTSFSSLASESAGEAELNKLQNQYRILEGVRKAESEDSQNEIRKQVSGVPNCCRGLTSINKEHSFIDISRMR